MNGKRATGFLKSRAQEGGSSCADDRRQEWIEREQIEYALEMVGAESLRIRQAQL
jgi:hypothetical protein